MTKKDKDLIEVAKQVIRSQAQNYLKYPNINSVGVGYKIKGNGKKKSETKEISIQFSVDKKAKAEKLEALQKEGTVIIPKKFAHKNVVIPTDVVERCFTQKYLIVEEKLIDKGDRKSRLNPIKPGISVGHYRSSAGTIGCIVYDKYNGSPYILSNWHVLDNNGLINDLVVQPGPYDDNNTDGNHAGYLKNSHLGVAGDCAVASIKDRDFDEKIYELGVVPKRIAKAELGDKVIKSGRTTGITHGIVSRVHVTSKLDYDGQGEKQIGGFEIVIDPEFKPVDGEISLGGDSGSLWLATEGKGKPTDIAVGLHFAGEAGDDQPEYALACNIHSVLEKLEVSLTRPSISPEKLKKDNVHLGYKPDFIGQKVPLPELTSSQKSDAAKFKNNTVLDYTHFSLSMNKSRRLAYYTAVNIDGNSLKRIIRKKDKWVFDKRIPEDLQCGNDIYENNKLDRGHLVRRLDPVWGPDEIAKQAEKDTFHYTNAAPQHANLNQKTWNDLEDYLLNNTDDENLKINVFTGPVFDEDKDPKYRDIQIPLKFWKVVSMVKEDGNLSSTAYILDQEGEMDNLEKVGFEFGEFRTYQTTIAEIESLTGLKFGKLKNFDPKAIRTEAIGKPGRTYIDRMEKIVL